MIRTHARYSLGFAVATAIMLLVGLSILLATRQVRADNRWITHSRDVIEHLTRVRAELLEGIAAQRSYLLTGDRSFRVQHDNVRPAIREDLATLTALTLDDPQAASIRELAALIELRLDTTGEVIRQYESGGLAAVQERLRSADLRALMTRIEQLQLRIQNEQQALLLQRIAVSRRNTGVVLALATLGIPLSLSIVWAIYALLRREVRQREAAQARADTLNHELAQSVARLEQAGNDLADLGHYVSLLLGCQDFGEALDVTRYTLLKLLPGAAGAVYLLSPSQDHAELAIGWGQAPAEARGLMMPSDCWALRRAQPHFVDNLHGETACQHFEPPAQDVHIASACLPLSAQAVSLGVLVLFADGPGPIPRIEIAAAVAEQLSLALGNLRLQEKLRQQSIRDALSGLYNRRYLEESLPRELARCQRREKPLALLMLDLDHFKVFNDTHGHTGGDTLIAAFGRLLLAHCRPEDIACRYGGEEFTLILPEADQDTALQRAEEIRTAAMRMTIAFENRSLAGTSLSIGLAMYPQHAHDSAGLERLADAALYQAKRNGRNRIELAAAV